MPCLFDLGIGEQDAAHSDTLRLYAKEAYGPNSVDCELEAVLVPGRPSHFPVDDIDLGANSRAIVDAALDRELSERGETAEGVLDQSFFAGAHAFDECADVGIFKE